MTDRYLADGKSRADRQSRDKRIKGSHRDKCGDDASMKCLDPTSAIHYAIAQDAASRCISQARHGTADERVATVDADAHGHVDFVERREDLGNILRIILAVSVQ